MNYNEEVSTEVKIISFLAIWLNPFFKRGLMVWLFVWFLTTNTFNSWVREKLNIEYSTDKIYEMSEGSFEFFENDMLNLLISTNEDGFVDTCDIARKQSAIEFYNHKLACTENNRHLEIHPDFIGSSFELNVITNQRMDYWTETHTGVLLKTYSLVFFDANNNILSFSLFEVSVIFDTSPGFFTIDRTRINEITTDSILYQNYPSLNKWEPLSEKYDFAFWLTVTEAMEVWNV